MAEEEIAEEEATSPVLSHNKRKLDDLESDEAPKPDFSSPSPSETLADSKEPIADSNGVQNTIPKEEEEIDVQLSDVPEAKRPRLDEEIDGSEPSQQVSVEVPHIEDSQHPSTENVQQPAIGDPQQGNLTAEPIQQPVSGVPQRDDHPTSNIQQPALEVPQQVDPPTSNIQQPSSLVIQQGNLPTSEQPNLQSLSRKIEVPNNKVGVLIGKAGDTIRFLQQNSGARVQITRDGDADPDSSTRPVELIGTLENINKAEQLIKDVIAEADAGGSPSLVARGFSTAQTGAEQVQIQVPYEKVGLIIGKGGETIKNLQTKSGARIQVILQNIPEGDASKERTVRVTGNKNQIEAAREMIKEVMSQNPVRPSPLSGGFSQPAYRPRGPAGTPRWGPRVPPPAQPTTYGYQQGGTYPSETPQYPPQTYSGYPQQQAPRTSFNAGWDRRPSALAQIPPQSGAYDHYSQGGHATDGPALATHIPTASAAAPTSALVPGPGPTPTQTNYNYGQPQGYGQPTPYLQSAASQQSYGHGYDNSKYENQAPSQHAYGGHGNPQTGAYPQQVSTETGYVQQPYSKPAYGMPSQGPPPQSYEPPHRANQPGDVPYQGPVPSAQTYGPQQSYPYASGGPQQSYPYGPTPATNDGYTQPSSVATPAPGYAPQGGPVAPGYTQQGGQVAPGYAQQGWTTPGYAQQGGQPGPAYAQQGGQSGGYVQYPPSQPGYGDQPALNNANYGYQGSTGASAGGQMVYVQPTPNPSSYDQSMPQSGYGSHAGTAPVGYAMGLSPQPGYTQYESGQMYGQHS